MMRLSSRLERLPAPATIAMSTRARVLKAEGRDIISLALGQPDFASPDLALEGAIAEVKAGNTGYPPIAGQKTLLEAVAHKFKRDNGLETEISRIMVGNGGKQLIFNAFMASLNEGDEVIIPAPYWVSYPLIARMFGGKEVILPCDEKDGFRPSPARLKSLVTAKTKWLVLNFPNNPTGAILEKEDLEKIAEILRQFPHVQVMCDEIYEHLTFDGRKHCSLAQIAPDLGDRILIINGVSKAYAMTGWRVGFAFGSVDLIKAMIKVQGNTTSGICTLAQGAAASVLSLDDMSFMEKMKETYERRRNEVVTALREIEGISCALPQGAFYAFPGIKSLIGKVSEGGRVLENDVAFAEALLEEAHLAIVPGASFGMEGYLRLSFAASDRELLEACRRMKKFVQALK